MKSNNSETKKWIIVLLIGTVALAVGIVVLMFDRNVDENYTGSATAVVVGYEEEEEYDSNMDMLETVYYPVLSFVVDGKEITERYSQYYSDMEYDIGESVDVKYLPEDPVKYSIVEDDRGVFITWWESIVGILLIALAIYKLIKIRKCSQDSM